ncbi:MAG: single-stranded DNA-binding protein [bacterium]|nr:single-stranded DNA-binding protein [bacterium]
MMNHISLIGRLTADPELRYTPSGKAVAGFSLAVDRRVASATGGKQTDFIPIVCWAKTAEVVTQYLTKGRLVAIEGRLQIRSYEAKDGQKRRVAEVIANGVTFLPDGKNGKPKAAEAEAAAEDADAAAEAAPEAAPVLDVEEDDVPF